MGVPKTGVWSLVVGLMVMVTVAVPVRAGVPGTPWSDACPHGNIIRHNIWFTTSFLQPLPHLVTP